MLENAHNMFNVRTHKPDAILLFESHLEKEFGPSEFVIHDMKPTLPHVDVHVFPPNDYRPWYTLVTSGMSDQVMHVTQRDGSVHDGFLELVLCLPERWKISQASMTDPDWAWPITLLQRTARYPFEADTYLWLGHTIPYGEPFGPWTDLNSMSIFPPVFSNLEPLMVSNDKTIDFMQLLLLHENEMQYQLKYGLDELRTLFADTYEDNYAPEIMFDITRASIIELNGITEFDVTSQ